MEGDLQFWGNLRFQIVISIHSLRMEGDAIICSRVQVARISIHSLRMEGDSDTKESLQVLTNFNPLPPHGGRRLFRRQFERI